MLFVCSSDGREQFSAASRAIWLCCLWATREVSLDIKSLVAAPQDGIHDQLDRAMVACFPDLHFRYELATANWVKHVVCVFVCLAAQQAYFGGRAINFAFKHYHLPVLRPGPVRLVPQDHSSVLPQPWQVPVSVSEFVNATPCFVESTQPADGPAFSFHPHPFFLLKPFLRYAQGVAIQRVNVLDLGVLIIGPPVCLPYPRGAAAGATALCEDYFIGRSHLCFGLHIRQLVASYPSMCPDLGNRNPCLPCSNREALRELAGSPETIRVY